MIKTSSTVRLVMTTMTMVTKFQKSLANG